VSGDTRDRLDRIRALGGEDIRAQVDRLDAALARLEDLEERADALVLELAQEEGEIH
jgi:hypothetical protein